LTKTNALKSNIICYAPKCTDLNIELHVDSIAIPCVNRYYCILSTQEKSSSKFSMFSCHSYIASSRIIHLILSSLISQHFYVLDRSSRSF